MNVKYLVESGLEERSHIRSGRIYQEGQDPKYGVIFTWNEAKSEDDLGLDPNLILGTLIGLKDTPESTSNDFFQILGGYFYHDNYPDPGTTTHVFGIALDPEFGITENGTTTLKENWKLDHNTNPSLDESQASEQHGPHHGWTFIVTLKETEKYPASRKKLKIFVHCPEIKDIAVTIGACIYDPESLRIGRNTTFEVSLAEIEIRRWKWDFGDGSTKEGDGKPDEITQHAYKEKPDNPPKLCVEGHAACGVICKEVSVEEFATFTECPQLVDIGEGNDAATRSLLQATYSSLKAENGDQLNLARPFEKAFLISHIKPTPNELAEISASLRKKVEGAKKAEKLVKDQLAAIEVIYREVTPARTLNVISGSSKVGDIRSDVLISIVGMVIQGRKEKVESFRINRTALLDEFSKASGKPGTQIPKAVEKELPDLKESAQIKPKLKSILDWAIANKVKTPIATQTIELANALSLDSNKMSATDFEQVASRQIQRHAALVQGLKLTVESEILPVGYLHLERLSFVPAGIERGDLVYTVPLSPGEEVNITHREWSQTSEEFEKIVIDFLEEFSEEGVTEKSELSQSVNSQEQHSSAFNTGVTASGSYGTVRVTATAGYNASESATASEQIARNHSSDMTRKASSRSKKEHKISFRVASASETEDQTVRRIKNPHADRAARVDYYQLLRKWRVDLHRYGIRLTYDIVLPEPGWGLLSKIIEIQDVRRELEKPFEDLFLLKPGDIDRDNYPVYASDYGVAVPELPPDAETEVLVVDQRAEPSDEKYVVEINIPDKYIVHSSEEGYGSNKIGGKTSGIVVTDISGVHRILFSAYSYGSAKEEHYSGWNGRTGKLSVHVNLYNIKFWYMSILIHCELKPSEYAAWQMRTWEVIRNGAQTAYYERRQTLKDRLARLEEELGAEDALSLRKKEREEVMKGILRWLGIPGFEFYPTALPDILYDPESGLVDPSVNASIVRTHGEIIKFLHQAIEWENMLYFLYPYFWADPGPAGLANEEGQYWEFKKYLEHPDPMHRAFLKAGSTRVVLTIRPGFEKSFLAFVDTGDINQIPPPPYITIAEEFENHAKTNYPGIPSANPVENARMLIYPKQKKAWEQMQQNMLLLERYYEANSQAYPSTAQGLVALNAFTDAEIPNVHIIDPWGYEYVYRSPGLFGDYDLLSYGADGEPGGEDENSDITSWAEASLVGTWHEYTPTSALDIAFDETMPRA
jgi:hypothetical protein